MPKLRYRSLDESVFESVTEAASYWSGFLMADGSVMAGSDGGQATVQLGLAACDIGHVESFRRFLGSTHAISQAVVRGHRAAIFRVKSQRLANALGNRGIIPRKTFTAELGQGLQNDRHAWRGVIDGDGTLGLYRMGRHLRFVRPVLTVAGARPLMEQFVRYAQSVTPCKLTTQTHGRIWKVQLSCNTAYLVVKNLYENCTVALPRKLAIAREIIHRGPIRAYHKDWSWLTAAMLQKMYKDHGSNWEAVARTLGVCSSTVRDMRVWRDMIPGRTRLERRPGSV